VVKDENSTTEILCNLMKFKLFREKFLGIFIPVELINEISFEDFETQVSLNEGRPDIIIENEKNKFIIEVKTGKYTKLTGNQPIGYLNHLLNQKNENKRLIFILPEGYIYEKNINDIFVLFNNEHPSNEIEKQIVYWEDIIRIIESNELHELNPILNEFYKLLVMWYIPEQVTFDYSEIKTMYSSELPDILTKLAKIVDEIYGKATSYEPNFYMQRKFPPDEYGMYFNVAGDKGALFFGIWLSLWKEKKLPICFGVDDSCSEEVKSAFEEQYRGRIIQYSDYKLSWFDESVFSQDDCIDEIWNTLEAFLSKM
jgi:hypothetical protein